MTKRYTLNKMGASGEPKTAPQYIAALSVCLGSVAAGTVLGWTSNISKKLENGELNDIIMSTDVVGWVGSLATIGCLVICYPIGIICDKIGRKWGCLITVVPFTIGWACIIFASNVAMLCVGRFLAGLAGGAFCVAAPIYTSEISQNSIRGALGSYFQLLLTVGILTSYIAGAYMQPKAFSILCFVIPIIFAVVFFFQPETPVYYLKKNREEEARVSLQRLRGPDYNCEEELKEIKASLEKDSDVSVSFFDVAKTRPAKRAFVISFGLMAAQQLSGVNAVIFYTGDIFTAAGSSLDPNIATIIVGVMQVLATFASSLIIDRFGRRILLLGSIAFMTLSGAVLGIFFTLQERKLVDEDTVKSIGILPVICLIVFIVSFSFGIGPIPWMISAEIVPSEIKSVTCSMAATFNWFLAFLVTKFFANIKSALGGDVTFYIFACIALLGTIFIFFNVFETKGKSVAEIQAILNGTKPSQNESEGVDNPTYEKS